MRNILPGVALDWQIGLAAELAPGCLWFTASQPVTINLDADITDISISLSGTGILNVARLETEPTISREKYETWVTSRDGGSESFSLLQGGIIATCWEVNPEIRVSLPSSIKIRRLRLHNREGKYSYRAIRLRVECWNGSDRVSVWENDSKSNMSLRATGVELDFRKAATDTSFDQLAPLYKAGEKYLSIIRATLNDALARRVAQSFSALDAARRAKTSLIAVLTALAKLERSPLSCCALARVCEFFLIKSGKFELVDVNGGRSEVTISTGQAEQYELSLTHAFLHLTTQGVVENSRIYDYEFAVPDIGDMKRFETDLKDLTELLDIGQPHLGAHGFSLGGMVPKVDAYVSCMDEVIELIGVSGRTAALCYGTLLGAYREGAFIAHDDDVDLVVVFECTKDMRAAAVETMMQDLRKLGCSAEKLPQTHIVKVVPPSSALEIDVFPCFLDSNSDGPECEMYLEPGRLKTVEAAIMVPLCGEVKLYGKSYRGPADIEAFLRCRYGNTWSVPIKYEALSWLAEAEAREATSRLELRQ